MSAQHVQRDETVPLDELIVKKHEIEKRTIEMRGKVRNGRCLYEVEVKVRLIAQTPDTLPVDLTVVQDQGPSRTGDGV